MKSIYISIVVFFMVLPSIGNSQKYSGTVRYIVSHNWTKKIKNTEYISNEEKERASYVWGGDDDYKEYSTLKFNPSSSIYMETNETVEDYGSYSWRTNEYIIYRNIETNLTYDVVREFGKLYVIEDKIVCPNWKIKNDMREIAGHICMNAYYRDTIKDKDIVAWFALDLPLPFGPDRFGGLPGMILEIDMCNGALVISAESILLMEEELVIDKPIHKRKVKKITEIEYIQKIQKIVEDAKKMKRPYFYTIRY